MQQTPSPESTTVAHKGVDAGLDLPGLSENTTGEAIETNIIAAIVNAESLLERLRHHPAGGLTFHSTNAPR